MNDITVTVVGNVVGEVKMHFTSDGVPVASFRVAHNVRYFNKAENAWADGGSTFFTVSCWRGLGRNVAASLRRGMPVVVTGRLRQREYERERDGVLVRTTFPDIEAVAVGPDLARGVTTFERTKGQAVAQHEARTVADALGAAAIEGAEQGAEQEADVREAPAA